jgi:uncharacterized protein (DUF433 family)/DNA-binding transcriptional MerR regulator
MIEEVFGGEEAQMSSATAARLEDVVSVPAKLVAEIARISDRQVSYWEQKDIARPTVIASPRASARRVRLYDYTEMMSLMIAAELRGRNVSLQHIRRVVDHLRTRGYDRPLTDVEFATVGAELYFRHPDGTWEGGLRPDQIVFHQVLNLEPLRMRILDGIRRPDDTVGRIERRRGTHGSKPVISGTRVPVDTVRRYLAAGRSEDQILMAFPTLTKADLRTAARMT